MEVRSPLVTAEVWPNLFIVGAARAGTTSLWAWLAQHPDIFMPKAKEPNFFSQHPIGRSPVHDESEYLRLFSRGTRKKYRGDASPSYLWHVATPRKIKSAVPDAKILISLRDPVARSYSMHQYLTRLGREHRSFLEMVRNELSTSSEDPLTITRRSFYADSVQRYLDIFGENVRVLIFEELIADVRGHMEEVFSFLEINPEVARRMRVERFNSSARPRNAVAAKILGSPALRLIAGRLVPLKYQPSVEQRFLAPRSKMPPMEPEAHLLLESLYAEDVVRVERLLGRSLPWPTATAVRSSHENSPNR